ncbi:ankyrin repeat domain-containing protein [Luteibacter aegosomaticola]|uniref:ankyrin repeat domain-containing protein n=1 Tax=Luteibacter aegosomaticola TaxID=2911538 RepID=UPI001FFC10C9|nr:ankyrin repeat domain-containing protein [Luteibacter aegosomaticola]UPG88306.1 ankyrin repeat domain-containing protein [Luteibacter aegosomaticola]
MNPTLQRQLCDAAWDGNDAVVAALINHPEVVPDAHHSAALVHAAHRGKTGCVRLLLPVSNANARNAEPLWRAATHRRAACVRLLVPVSDTSGWEQWMWSELPGPMRHLLATLGNAAT